MFNHISGWNKRDFLDTVFPSFPFGKHYLGLTALKSKLAGLAGLGANRKKSLPGSDSREQKPWGTDHRLLFPRLKGQMGSDKPRERGHSGVVEVSCGSRKFPLWEICGKPLGIQSNAQMVRKGTNMADFGWLCRHRGVLLSKEPNPQGHSSVGFSTPGVLSVALVPTTFVAHLWFLWERPFPTI